MRIYMHVYICTHNSMEDIQKKYLGSFGAHTNIALFCTQTLHCFAHKLCTVLHINKHKQTALHTNKHKQTVSHTNIALLCT